MVDSCRECSSCKAGLEQFCLNGMTQTYNSPDKKSGGFTFGGYSSSIVVDEAFTLKISDKLDLAATAPLLCAGITTYSPLRHWKVTKGQKVAVLGLGGLGHMAVKYAAALGAEVTLLSSSASKKADAARLGAHDFVVTSDEATLGKLGRRFNVLIDTVSAPHDIARYAETLATDGVMVLLGVPEKPALLPAFALIPRRRSIACSLIGGIKETQEMLDFSAAHGITADVETIPVRDIDKAYARMLKGDVRYRFVIDTASLKRD